MKKKTHEQYVEELKEIHPYVKVCETYINAKHPILHKCTKDDCGYEWLVTPDNILHDKSG